MTLPSVENATLLSRTWSTRILGSSNVSVKPTNKNTTSFSHRKGKPVCMHYGLTGHIVDKCHKLHGYPPDYKFEGSKGSTANQVVASEAINEFP